MITPDSPDEIVTELEVQDDNFLENNETFTLELSLNQAAMDSGARFGTRNTAQVTIINDDGKINHITRLWIEFKCFFHYSSGPSYV